MTIKFYRLENKNRIGPFFSGDGHAYTRAGGSDPWRMPIPEKDGISYEADHPTYAFQTLELLKRVFGYKEGRVALHKKKGVTINVYEVDDNDPKAMVAYGFNQMSLCRDYFLVKLKPVAMLDPETLEEVTI